MNSGSFVSDAVVSDIVAERIRAGDCKHGFILDGFPRTLPQTRVLEKIAESQGHSIVVVEIDVPRDLLRKRLAGRRTCSVCGAIYHTQFKPSKNDGVCDLEGAPLFTRSDDHEESIARRLGLYDEKTHPLLDYYSKTGRLYKVDGTGTSEEVGGRIANVLKLTGGAPATQSVADGRVSQELQ